MPQYTYAGYIGLGQAWLSKAQYWLAKIYHEEGSPASMSDEDDAVAEKRRHTANYVEARAVLMPAVDFFGRSVQSAQVQGCLTGDLLALVSFQAPTSILLIIGKSSYYFW